MVSELVGPTEPFDRVVTGADGRAVAWSKAIGLPRNAVAVERRARRLCTRHRDERGRCLAQPRLALGRAAVALVAVRRRFMAWMLLYPLWIVRRRARLPRLPRPRTVFVESLFALLGTAVAMVVLFAVFSVLFFLFGDRATTTMPWKPIAASPNWYDSLGLLVLACLDGTGGRGGLFPRHALQRLRQRLHVVVAAPVQAIIFGLTHHFGAADTTGVVLIGLALALLYEWRKTLLAPVLMHALVNVLAMAVMAQSIAADAAAPRLGVSGETHERGVRLTNVVPDTAAASAGLQVGDVIVSLDGEPVADMVRLDAGPFVSRHVGQRWSSNLSGEPKRTGSMRC